MSVTSGFFNSKNGDRKYNAEQMSSIFDGIIRDGIFQHVGTSMMVTAGSGMEVIVGIGRAWFKHTWTSNDSLLPLAIEPAEVLFKRIDAVVLEVDNRENFRQNSIKVIKGTPGNSPVKPALIKENDRAQYVLAYVEVGAAVASITQANITNMVGTGDTPFITAPLEKMNIDALVAQWQSQYTQWRDGLNANAQNWRTEFERLMNNWKTGITQDYDTWTAEKRQAFDNWFGDIQSQLSGDVAANLANRITALENKPTEDAVLNKNKQVTAQDVNNANYPFPYVAAISFGKQVGLPTDWAYIHYFRHQNNDGYGSQIAIKLDRANQEGDNTKLWTMKIRVASAMTWGAWENVATSIPKGHYPVVNLNACREDGAHYYFNGATTNRPLAHGDGIVSVYAYNAGNNEQQSINPHIVQVSHSWHSDSIFMRSGKMDVFTPWKEILTSDNAAFSVDDAGLHMRKTLFFNAADGSTHTLQEVFQSASEGKTKVANTLTGMGTPTSTTATWDQITNNLKKHKYKAGQRLTTNFTINEPAVLKTATAVTNNFPLITYVTSDYIYPNTVYIIGQGQGVSGLYKVVINFDDGRYTQSTLIKSFEVTHATYDRITKTFYICANNAVHKCDINGQITKLFDFSGVIASISQHITSRRFLLITSTTLYEFGLNGEIYNQTTGMFYCGDIIKPGEYIVLMRDSSYNFAYKKMLSNGQIVWSIPTQSSDGSSNTYQVHANEQTNDFFITDYYNFAGETNLKISFHDSLTGMKKNELSKSFGRTHSVRNASVSCILPDRNLWAIDILMYDSYNNRTSGFLTYNVENTWYLKILYDEYHPVILKIDHPILTYMHGIQNTDRRQVTKRLFREIVLS